MAQIEASCSVLCEFMSVLSEKDTIPLLIWWKPWLLRTTNSLLVLLSGKISQIQKIWFNGWDALLLILLPSPKIRWEGKEAGSLPHRQDSSSTDSIQLVLQPLQYLVNR